ncbi:hypothetical protein HZS61_007741 [Fusarium oxysporum f. sp. conglutinans]|uniref:Zn(2)-C6 fungal-type domain-containing protein n=1 Tax=Fusarium oxysporum f. sp. conglutinans TaxID=100902 RepID=A0A8H6G897_FUSOX|nr:hypothetical protein HZS61_007741 [Fusarium oxysporum f. sp. conglutinans]
MESPDHSSSTRQFKRSYVACVSCRARKSRCIIKDNPPCAKCAREHRECRFDRRPRAPKHRDAPKWTRGNVVDAAPATQPVQAANPSPSEDLGFNSSPNNTNHPLYNRVQSTIVTGTNDALDFLSTAAGQHSIAGSAPSQGQPSASHVQSDGPKVVSGGSNGVGFTITTLSEPDDACLDMWDKCRFVRQGWFTAQEAVTYIDLFFEKLAPLSPVVLDQFRSHASHEHLVYREAMLCCTLLMISSRFFTLPGAGGTSRSHYVHQRLWSHCEVLIRRILLGQEKTSTSQTRTIGTIESLILISDWHPRALHLPPETDGWDGLLVTPGYDRVNRKHINNEVPLIRWREDVFEPAKRANRMSWMLLGMANNLAYELGIFSGQPGDTTQAASGEALRGRRAQKLLYNYLTQTAIRLGYPSVFPEGISVIASRLSMQETAATTNPDEALSAFITPKDAKFLQDVITDTKKVLHIATMSGFREHLPYAPARVKISVISSSVFLLKALSVGSTHTDVNDALYTLDQCTSILKDCPADDMDFALRYADLIEKHTAQFRAHLTQSRGLGSSNHSGRASIPRNVAQGETGIDGPNSFLSGLDSQQLGEDGAMMNFDMEDTWVSLPFDSSIAPFGEGCDQVALGLDIDALNFLWSLPELVQGETGFA